MADQKIPYEFQTDFGQIGELEKIAELMQKQRLLNQEQMRGQMVSGHFVRMSPMQGLADMFAAYQGGKANREAAKLRTELPQRLAKAESDEREGIARLMTGNLEPMGPPDPEGRMGLTGNMPNLAAAAQRAAAAKFENNRKFGDDVRSMNQTLMSSAYPKATQASQEVALRQGGNALALSPDEGEKFGPPSVIPGLPTPPSGQPVMGQQNLRTQRWNELGGRGSNTSVTVGADKGRGRILEKEHEYMMTGKGYEQGLGIAKGVENVTSAMNVLATVPMNTGIDADWKTVAQKLGQLTGREVPEEAAGTELYQRYVVPMTAEVIKGFGAGTGLSDADRKFALQAIGQASSDPRMAKIALAFMFRGLMKEAAAQQARIGRAKRAAVAEGYDPEMFETVPFSASVAPEFGLPEGFEKPGVLEGWMKEIIKSKSAKLQDAVTRNLGQR